MRTNVSFRHPAEFVPVSDADCILSVDGAQWFAALLKRVPELQIEEPLCQEDWGVVLFARRNEKTFWIGLSPWEDDGYWLAHFHHGSGAWLQRFSSSGKQELARLVSDFHNVLVNEPHVSQVTWYEEREMREARPTAYTSPV